MTNTFSITIDGTIDWYKKHFLLYMAASPEMRKESKKHWIGCHKKNMESGNEYLIIFSAKILAGMMLADDMIAQL